LNRITKLLTAKKERLRTPEVPIGKLPRQAHIATPVA
jgi:hypothetical protein